MRRTTVFADETDLAILKAAAARRGVAEAELIRDAIHLAAMANRTWDEPFFSRTHRPAASQPTSRADGDDAPPDNHVADDDWADQVEAYERTKSPAR